jgi:ubiquinone biosynthesis protein COQ9
MSPSHLQHEKDAILAAALPNVAFDGWTRKLLLAAGADAGQEPAMVLRAFPRGPIDLLEHFIADADRRMLEGLEALDLPGMKIRQRIATAIRLRLEQQAGNKEAIRRALGLMAQPAYGAVALGSLYRTVDAIWYACGDQSTDFNYYTKRALLAGVYSATLIYWLEDRSEGHGDTWEFLDRRIADVMRIQGLRGRAERLLESLPDPFRLLRRHG